MQRFFLRRAIAIVLLFLMGGEMVFAAPADVQINRPSLGYAQAQYRSAERATEVSVSSGSDLESPASGELGNKIPLKEEVFLAASKAKATDAASYASLMRELSSFRNKSAFLSEEKPAAKILQQKQLSKKLSQFIANEETRLRKTHFAPKKEREYLILLRKQLRDIGKTTKGAQDQPLDVKIPKNPGRFNFGDDKIPVRSLRVRASASQGGQEGVSAVEKAVASNVNVVEGADIEAAESAYTAAADLFKIPQAHAQTEYPVLLEDTRADEREVFINSEIRELAISLRKNPVEITNFVRNHVTYEPYFGAKKGALGCLREAVCNDTDAASLAISLLRAAGIPARYQKSMAKIRIEDLKKLLGVSDAKSAYYALAGNRIPVFTIDSTIPDLTALVTADLSRETHFAVEWTFPELFYEEDERGGNFDNALDLSGESSVQTLNETLAQYPKKQWIPADVILKPYRHTQNTIATDGTNVSPETFWQKFLQEYTGSASPLAQFRQEVLAASGRDLDQPAYHSLKEPLPKSPEILPATLPFELLGVGQSGQTVISPETWSQLPESRRHHVTISLLKADQAGAPTTTVFSHTFSGSEINNEPLTLSYEGVTQTDRDVIESFGGIHATPSPLAAIKPVFSSEHARFDDAADGSTGAPSLRIGDSLIMRFTYALGDTVFNTDEKFSVAGNEEGIFLVLSKVSDDFSLDDAADPNRNSKILLEGNWALAREHLRKMQTSGQELGEWFDHSYNVEYMRAVVTQNRALAPVSGTPTTFDFSGLTIDATAYINDYANRGDFRDHRADFHRLWGLEASYYEGQVFNDIAGLTGISTVQGIQHAYRNPAEYTVHTVTQANAAEIDALNLSANTKANMRRDVAAGSTIITPNKAVQIGTFRGILYISLRQDGTAQYAIGEQVSNGGFTSEGFQIMLVITDGKEVARFVNEGTQDDPDNFVFADKIGGSGNPMGSDMKCRIAKADALDIVNKPGWLPEYGVPCMKGSMKFGTGNIEHIYTLATDGAKFDSQGRYNYWIKESDVKNVLASDIYNDNVENLKNLRLDGTFKFNTAAGTYSQFGHYGGPYEESIFTECQECLTAYYEPNSAQNNRGYGRVVYGHALSKLEESHYDPKQYICARESNCGPYSWILYYLGYPVRNRAIAGESTNGTKGQYQDFVGGQIYMVDEFFGKKIYYVPGKIDDYFNAHSGTNGKFGFPIKDPLYDQAQDQAPGVLFQDFESGRIDLINEVTTDGKIIQTIKSQYIEENNQEYWEGMWDLFFENGIYGLVIDTTSGVAISKGISTMMGFLVKKYPKKIITKAGVKLIPAVGWAFLAYSVMVSLDQLTELHAACNSNVPTDDKNPSYYCGKRDATAVLVAVGFLGEQTARAYKAKSWFGVASAAARQGKYKLYKYTTDETYNNIKDILVRGDYKKTRTKFFEDVNNLQEADIQLLGKDRNLIMRLLDAPFLARIKNPKLHNIKAAKDINKFQATPSWEPDSSAPGFTRPTNLGDLLQGDIVRVFAGTPSNPTREWWLFRSDIVALKNSVPSKYPTLAEAIKQRYSLLELPTHFMKGSIKADVEFRAGPAAKWHTNTPGNTFGSREGGGLQLEIVGFDQLNARNSLDLEGAGNQFITYPISNL